MINNGLYVLSGFYPYYMCMQEKDIVRKITRSNREKRKQLNDIRGKLERLIKMLPRSRYQELQTAYPNFERKLTAIKNDLDNQDCAIVVAGKIAIV